MGMFTSVLHPIDGRELQIKTGDDLCETYRVGDSVNWGIGFYPNTGRLFDGIYSSYSNYGEDDWVIIQDHVVTAVEPKEESYEVLYAKYQIQEPSRDLWSDEAWAEQEARRKKIDEEWQAFQEEHKDKSPEERACLALGKLVRRRLDYTSLGRQIFKIEPLTPKALHFSSKDDDET